MKAGRIRLVVSTILAAAVLAGCGGDEQVAKQSDPIADAAATLVESGAEGTLDSGALEVLADSGDARFGWLIADLMRFLPQSANQERLIDSFEELTGRTPRTDRGPGAADWVAFTDYLIARDLPAPPGYRELKAELFTVLEPGWEPFFADADSEIDWRLVTWGGVLIDDRPLGARQPCPDGCIPSLDDPELTPASEGDWYADELTVFGVVVDGGAVAFPKNIMEVHEMVNATIGGRRVGIPYCTLCGSAQAYFTDSVPDRFEPPVLRTSGLLSRSNKVMYDLRTESVFDTFTGDAISGPLQGAGVTLEQASVVVSSWGAWKRRHPQTLIVAEDGGIGESYPADPLGGRDDNGPIFPVGDVDPRLPIQENVVGAIAPGGMPVAFPVESARDALAEGEEVAVRGIEAAADGDGLRILGPDGEELPAHQAFWFAWSQFNPKTELWNPRR